MSAHDLRAPAELARLALRRIAELRLPPTPELFAHHYYAMAGARPTTGPLTPDAADAMNVAIDPKLAERVDQILAQATSVTRDLADNVSVHSDEVAASLESLVADMALPAGAVDVLQAVVASANAMHRTLLASHAELLDARRSLSAIEAELKESRHLLEKDPLTGTDNRRAMTIILDREMARSRRDKSPLSVAMVDLDHFKKINDTHGHAAGDAALIHLTQLAHAVLRGKDAFVRYGGEEFLLVLSDTGLYGAVNVAERVQQALARQPFVHHGQVIPMTFSAGVATLSEEPETQDSLLERADKALYDAKQTGRNKVVARA